jgi:general secretion pathway protein N
MLQRRTLPAFTPSAAKSRKDPVRPWAWAFAGGVSGLLVALLYFAPARWLAHGVALASHGHILFEQTQGTVWHGSAQLVFSGGAGSIDRAPMPQRLRWKLLPDWIGLQGSIAAECCTPQALHIDAYWRPSGFRVHVGNGQSTWPTAPLVGLGTPWNTLQFQGQLVAQTEGLELHWIAGRFQVQGQAQIDALRVSTRLSTLQPLGDYRLSLFSQAGTPKLEVQTLQGDLQITGNGEWTGAGMRFRGVARAAAGKEAALSNLLLLLGRPQGNQTLISLG